MSGWLFDALIAAALLMAGVLLIRVPVRRAFGPQVAYWLWALPLLRLVTPSLTTGWWRAATSPITRVGETITVFVVDPTIRGVIAPVAFPLGRIAALVWATGVVVFLGWHLVQHARFRRRILAGAALLDQIEGIQIVVSAHAPGPIAFGLRHRYVAVPPDFATRYDAEERGLALAHELEHHRRRDLHANWAALIVLALHWFDPLAWYAFRAFRADQELANDARVLAGRSPAARHAYGRALVKATSPAFPGSGMAPACHLHTITNLKGRLRMLTTTTTSRRRLVAGSATVALIVTGGLGLTASGSQATERVKARVDEALHIAPLPPIPSVARIAPVAPVASPQSAPVPPAPPAPAPTPTVDPAGPRQLRTVIIKHDPQGKPTLLVQRAVAPLGATLPDGLSLPKDFTVPDSCRQRDTAKPQTYVVRGNAGEKTYTVVCTVGAKGPGIADTGTERGTYQQALTALRAQRQRVEAQTEPAISGADRQDIYAALDKSIAQVEADLAKLN